MLVVICHLIQSPFSNNITFEFDHSTSSNVQVEVYNALGATVLIEELSGRNSITINTDNLNKGIYIAKLMVDHKAVAIQKLFKN